ncbi:MAG: imidazole glycerol phosphate synthase cyclase subunit [Candidatus Poseidoniia archaeon]|jgi:cyclase|nr:imidazole glycerol phosphate synthase cyclase subunit [Candidatus Poseidoniia archaeon]
MLKKRIVGCIIVKNGIAVQSIDFKCYLPIGSVVVTAEFLNKWEIDEIILLDIEASAQGRSPDFSLVTAVSERIFVPLTVGGGLATLDDMRRVIHSGADKISINRAALDTPHIITDAARVFGKQCIVVSIDAKQNKKGGYDAYVDSGATNTGLDVIDWAKEIEKRGAGEIFVNSIDRDGSKQGYDLELLKKITNAVAIPVIACGGAGHPNHFLDGFTEGNASATAAANFFNFTEHSPIIVKAYVRDHGIDVRLDSHAVYEGIDFIADSGRIAKRPEAFLEQRKFEYHSEEII